MEPSSLIAVPRTASLREIAVVLRGAARVLAMCHISPDGDAIGSLLGLAWILRELPQPPEVVAACADPVPEALLSLPRVDTIRRDAPEGPWDVVVCLDASDAARLGDIYRPETYSSPVIVLDHHVTNLGFGTLNHVDTSAAATAQIVAGLADALDVAIGYHASVCLLTGLVTDTLCFRTANVTPELFIVAARLMSAGADVSEIAQRSLYSRPLAVLRVWGAALSRMQMEGPVLWTTISREMRAEAGLTGSGEVGLSSQLINATEARIAAVFSETEDRQVDVSLRARPRFDVAGVALRLGGGGHPQAAGCLLRGTLAEVTQRVLPLLAEAASQQVSDGR